MLVAVGHHRAAPVPAPVADDVHLAGEERVGGADDRADVEVVLPVLDGDVEVVPPGVEVGDDRLHRPVAVAVHDVAPVALGEQPLVVLLAARATAPPTGPTPTSAGPCGIGSYGARGSSGIARGLASAIARGAARSRSGATSILRGVTDSPPWSPRAARHQVARPAVPPRPVRRLRALGRGGGDLRRVRAARRLLPARRLAAVHGRPAGRPRARSPTRCGCAAWSCSWPRWSATRAATRSAPRSGRRSSHREDSRIFKKKYVDKTHEFFEKYGNRAIVLARFVPIVRTFITVMAGVGEMGFRRFMVYSAIGGALWASGRDPARLLPRPDRVRAQQHRGDAARDRADLGHPDRHRVPPGPGRGARSPRSPRH